MNRFFYITYTWEEGNRKGYGDFINTSEMIMIGNLKKHVAEVAKCSMGVVALTILEITQAEYEYNVEEFKVRCGEVK